MWITEYIIKKRLVQLELVRDLDFSRALTIQHPNGCCFYTEENFELKLVNTTQFIVIINDPQKCAPTYLPRIRFNNKLFYLMYKQLGVLKENPRLAEVYCKVRTTSLNRNIAAFKVFINEKSPMTFKVEFDKATNKFYPLEGDPLTEEWEFLISWANKFFLPLI